MRYYFITLRIPFDDEDTGLIVQAENADAAYTAALAQIKADRGEDEDTEEEDEDEQDPDAAGVPIVNYVLDCGETAPVIVQAPG